jgi:Trypsin-like peptidase domain
MPPDRVHAELGAPEEQPIDGMQYTFTQKIVRIDAAAGFRDLQLSQLDGLLLAQDWVADDKHHIWGSAVMVGPGVALTARHVVDEMRANGFPEEAGGQLFAVGCHTDRVELWRADSFTSVDLGDLSLLTLIRTTASAPGPARFSVAKMAARMPDVGEIISLIGFRAAELSFDARALMGLSLVGSVGPVTDRYPMRRDAHGLPNPSAAVAASTVNGMSGGAVFDVEGRLVGVISSGIAEADSFVLLSWPATYVPIAPKWLPMPPPPLGRWPAKASAASTTSTMC